MISAINATRIGLAAALFALLGLLAFAINTDVLIGVDTAGADWSAAHRSQERRADELFGYLGMPLPVLIVATVCGTLLSARARSWRPVLCVVGAVGAGVAIEHTLKAVIGRRAVAGPLLDYPHSFPSGHVTGTFALLGTIAVCLGAGRSRAVQAVLAAVVATAVLFVAVLAVYTGAHTVSDVLGGMLLGGAVVALAAAVLGSASGR